MSDSLRGAVKPGTVGLMMSGRLVYVDGIDVFSARLVALPDQPPNVGEDFYTNLIRGQQRFHATPGVQIEVIDPALLTDRNKHFLETGEVLPGPEPEKQQAKAQSSSGRRSKLGAGGVLQTTGDIDVVVKYPQYADKFTAIFKIIKEAAEPLSETAVIEKARAAGIWAGKKGQDEAIHWAIVQLIKAERIKVV